MKVHSPKFWKCLNINISLLDQISNIMSFSMCVCNYMAICFPTTSVCVVVCVQEQSQLIWGIKDKLRQFCSTNDMKELLIANGQEVPSGESNVRRLTMYLSQ